MLASAAVLSWVAGYTVGGRPMYLFAYGAGGVLLVSWLGGRRPVPLTAERTDVRPRVSEGELVTVALRLEARRRLTTLILEERLPSLLGPSPSIAIARLEPGVAEGPSYAVLAANRGAYQLGPLVVRWGDPFGLTQRLVPVCEPFELLVHPRSEPVVDRPLTRLWEDPPVRPPISKPWPMGMEFYGMRPYQPGDDPRRIVWRAFARTGTLLVREAEQGVTDKLVVLFDQDRRRHSSGAVSTSFETGARVVASLVSHHLREGYTVTLEGSCARLAPPQRGAGGRFTLLDSLARAARERGTLDGLLDRVLVHLGTDTELAVVTPHLTASSLARLQLLLGKGVSVMVIALTWTDDAVEVLGAATAMGAHVIEIGPHTNLTMAFRSEIGAGTR
jgi:uncharacterized protein (DUF58 family)